MLNIVIMLVASLLFDPKLLYFNVSDRQNA